MYLKLSIVRISLSPGLVYRFNAFLIKITISFVLFCFVLSDEKLSILLNAEYALVWVNTQNLQIFAAF